MAIVCFLGTSVTTGWIVAAGLLLALAVWIIVMAREIRDAIVLPDPFAKAGTETAIGSPEEGDLIGISRSEMAKAPCERPVLNGGRAALRFRNQGRRGVSLPRKPVPGR